MTNAAPSTANETIDDLPPEVLRLIFTFLGSGYFRFIGGTSRIFRELYLSTSVVTLTNPNLSTSVVYYCKRSTIRNVVSSVSCVELYLREEGTDIVQLRAILNGAASYGRLDILEWAHQREYSHACSEVMSAWAAKHGQLAALIWLKDHGFPWDYRTCSNAAAGGHLNILQWARANGCPWDKRTCTNAAKGGHLNNLQWARANGCPWNEMTCAYAAMNGHLEMLKWARTNECPWNEETCSFAAKGGHLNILQWARANGCPWDEETCSRAARGRHLNILQWARANGCPWNEETCSRAARGVDI